MAKRYRKSRKGRRKRNRKMRKKGKYDKSYFAICRSTGYIVCDTAPENASLGVHWGSSGGSGSHDQYIDDCSEFSTLTGFY